jgi:hypothetical protein
MRSRLDRGTGYPMPSNNEMDVKYYMSGALTNFVEGDKLLSGEESMFDISKSEREKEDLSEWFDSGIESAAAGPKLAQPKMPERSNREITDQFKAILRDGINIDEVRWDSPGIGRGFGMGVGFGQGAGEGPGGGGFGGFGGLGGGRLGGKTAISANNSILLRFNEFLPNLPAPPAGPMPQPSRTSWPEDARRLSDSLNRQPLLDAIKGGVDIDLKSSSFNPRTNDVASESRLTMLYSPSAWISRFTSDRNRTLVDWAVDATRAVLCEAMQIGRQRKAQKADQKLQLTRYGSYNDYSLIPLAQTFQSLIPVLKTVETGDVLLTLRDPNDPIHEQRFLIDPRRHVLLRREEWVSGKMSSQTIFDGFKEVAGCWWATNVTTKNAAGRTTGITTASIKAAGADTFEKQFQKALPDKNRALIIQEPLPDLAAARQASFEKRASFEDLLALMEHYSRSQQWKQVNDFWQNAETMVKDKPGVEWLEDAILEISRRNEELSQRYLARARRFANDKPQDVLFLCAFLQGRANRIMQANERLALHESILPVFSWQIARLQNDMEWRKTHAQLLQQAGRREEARSTWELLSREFPEDADIQIQYLYAMSEAGDLPRALLWIKALLSKPNHWTIAEQDSVRHAVVDRMMNNSPTAELLAFLEEWMAQEPAYQRAYEYYLKALIKMHQVEKANALISQWCEEGVKEESNRPKPEERKQTTNEAQIRSVRLRAAVQIILEDGFYSGSGRQYDERWNPLLANVVKGTYGSPALHNLANQIMQHYQFSSYQSQVLSNARAFAKACAAQGIPVEGGEAEGYTHTHQVILRVQAFGDAKEIASRLEANNIITNYQALPGDATFYHPSGIRMGVQEMTRFGMKEKDFDGLARFIADVVLQKKNRADDVASFRSGFATMEYCLTLDQTMRIAPRLLQSIFPDQAYFRGFANALNKE